MNYKEKCEELQREVDRLKLKMRSKENIIKSIIKKLEVKEPCENFSNNLKRINFDDLILLEGHLK